MRSNNFLLSDSEQTNVAEALAAHAPGFRVQQGGEECKVIGSTLKVPDFSGLPDQFVGTVTSVLRGMIDSELSYRESRGCSRELEPKDLHQNLLKTLEQCRVNRRAIRKYSGTASNLQSLFEYATQSPPENELQEFLRCLQAISVGRNTFDFDPGLAGLAEKFKYDIEALEDRRDSGALATRIEKEIRSLDDRQPPPQDQNKCEGGDGEGGEDGQEGGDEKEEVEGNGKGKGKEEEEGEDEGEDEGEGEGGDEGEDEGEDEGGDGEESGGGDGEETSESVSKLVGPEGGSDMSEDLTERAASRIQQEAKNTKKWQGPLQAYRPPMKGVDDVVDVCVQVKTNVTYI